MSNVKTWLAGVALLLFAIAPPAHADDADYKACMEACIEDDGEFSQCNDICKELAGKRQTGSKSVVEGRCLAVRHSRLTPGIGVPT